MKCFGFPACRLSGAVALGLPAISVGVAAASKEIPADLKSAFTADRYKIEGSAATGFHASNVANRIEQLGLKIYF
jgi:hypothetical protein